MKVSPQFAASVVCFFGEWGMPLMYRAILVFWKQFDNGIVLWLVHFNYLECRLTSSRSHFQWRRLERGVDIFLRGTCCSQNSNCTLTLQQCHCKSLHYYISSSSLTQFCIYLFRGETIFTSMNIAMGAIVEVEVCIFSKNFIDGCISSKRFQDVDVFCFLRTSLRRCSNITFSMTVYRTEYRQLCAL